MEALFIYLAKVSGLIALFWIAYTLFLKKETFFSGNRFYLLAGLLTSALLPFVIYTKIVWVTPQPMIMTSLPDVAVTTYAPGPEQAFTINWWYVAIATYAVGLLFFAGLLIKDLLTVSKMLKHEDALSKNGFKYIDSENVLSPFSFFKYIVYNSAVLQTQELTDIIAHEQVHSRQKHSLDVLISQLFCIVFWFNPFIWLYKKAISQNLEFIADAEATKTVSDKKAYQKTLLKITMQPECIAITNHFYQSLIKKRIVMLNKKQSNRRNFYKYALIAPALVAFIAVFQVEVVAQEKNPDTKTQTQSGKFIDLRVVLDITKDTKDEVFEKEAAFFKQQFEADVAFTNVKRNSNGELTAIKVTIKDKDNQESYPVYEVTADDDKGIEPFNIDIRRDSKTGKNIINFGQPEAKIKVIKAVTTTSEGDTIKKVNITKVDAQAPKNVLYIIDGIAQTLDSEGISAIDPDDIDSIEVLKNTDALIKKYGENAKNGVILVTTKKKKRGFNVSGTGVSSNLFDKSEPVNQQTAGVIFTTQPQTNLTNGMVKGRSYVYSTTYTANNNNDIINNILESSTVDYKKAYILINGKPSTAKELEKLNPKKVSTTTVAIGNEISISKYGEKAANGVIVVDLKGYESETIKAINAAAENKNITEDKDNTGYIIHKKSSKSDIKFYTKSLKDIGVEATISGIERNKEKEIIAIEIVLKDEKGGDDITSSYSNNKGIPNIYVGRKNSKAIAYATK